MRSRRGVVTEDSVVTPDRGRDGGHRFWGHCETCRRATSPWDDEYISWAWTLAGVLLESPEKGRRAGVSGEFAEARPGRFIRAALAGMTAVAEGLVDSHPELVESLRTGRPGVPTGALRFIAAVTPPEERSYVGGVHGGLQVAIPLAHDAVPVVAEYRSDPLPSAVIHHPPLSLLLVDEVVADRFPHMDCTQWLTMGIEESVHDFRLTLPAVRLTAPDLAGPDAFDAAVV